MRQAEEYIITDKGKWFTDEAHTSFLQCTTDALIDCLLGIFNGDKQRAERVKASLRQVTFEEYVNFGLYKD